MAICKAEQRLNGLGLLFPLQEPGVGTAGAVAAQWRTREQTHTSWWVMCPCTGRAGRTGLDSHG